MPLFPDIFKKSLTIDGVHCDVLIDPNERSGSSDEQKAEKAPTSQPESKNQPPR